MAEFAFPTNAPAPDASVFKAEPEFANLTEKQEQSLAALPAALEALGITGEELSREERCSFLKVRNWDPVLASAQIKEALAWRSEKGIVTIEQIAPFLRAPPGKKGPDGCVVLLEDGRGGCARDNTGRPVVVSIGMSHGSATEMQAQMAYVMQRAKAYALPGQCPHNTCTIIEVVPRDGAATTFRFPDKDVRTLFDLQTNVFPSSLGTSTHFCGLPRAVTWAFRLCKPFMSAEAYDNMKLKPSFDHLLDKHVTADCLLPRWASSGTFDFDLDTYVEWRASEEGVASEKLCKRGEGRAFNAKAPAGDLPEDAAAAVSAAELVGSGGVDVKKWGVISKRGSGRGLFGNRKWKEKLVVLQAGALVYFDETDHTSSTNLAAKVISLTACQVKQSDPEAGGIFSSASSNEFTLITPSRDFIFSSEEAEDWVIAIQSEIEAGAALTQEEQKSSPDDDAKSHAIRLEDVRSVLVEVRNGAKDLKASAP